MQVCINVHQANATFKIRGKILHGKFKLIQRGLDVGHRKTQKTKVAWKNSLSAEEVSWKRQQ